MTTRELLEELPATPAILAARFGLTPSGITSRLEKIRRDGYVCYTLVPTNVRAIDEIPRKYGTAFKAHVDLLDGGRRTKSFRNDRSSAARWVTEQRRLPEVSARTERRYELVSMPPEEPKRECGVCRVVKVAEEFASGRNGRAAWCAACAQEQPREVDELRALNYRLKAHARRALTTGACPDVRSYAQIITNDPCAYCGNPMQAIDHVVPLRHGGLHRWDNLAPACASCNTRKSARPLLEFLASLDR